MYALMIPVSRVEPRAAHIEHFKDVLDTPDADLSVAVARHTSQRGPGDRLATAIRTGQSDVAGDLGGLASCTLPVRTREAYQRPATIRGQLSCVELPGLALHPRPEILP
ncbi:hypothetical protein AN480_28905 (plasmid) [Mycobacterium intracellulare subsp. chimaera]|nr:hypothetical protein AN480_28905 [Mycobacterium intracellulare subsp. chimaera]